MPYYLLKPLNPYADGGPWDDYDCCLSVVVCAKNEREARKLAAEEHCIEGENCWYDDKQSSCVDISLDTTSRVIIQHINYG